MSIIHLLSLKLYKILMVAEEPVNSTLIRFFSSIEWTSCKFSSKSFVFLYFYEKKG